ncbi:AMP deaminase [Apostasia shenzhenica]|uniref:AMP deaminase n=1 Tax=Apostasia shenzhenica TaxID=1088818 RepID=A0A2I0B697_9ASPA|nr:AMP deaminase [Apostasia shenzhenica]
MDTNYSAMSPSASLHKYEQLTVTASRVFPMDAYALHMAMAALAGASVAAVSSYYLHRRAIAELLEIALAVERLRGGGEAEGLSENDGDWGSSSSRPVKERQRRGARRHGRRRRPERVGSACTSSTTAEVVNEKVDVEAGDAAGKGRAFSRIESLPGGVEYQEVSALPVPAVLLDGVGHDYAVNDAVRRRIIGV